MDLAWTHGWSGLIETAAGLIGSTSHGDHFNERQCEGNQRE
jgi:hypothetical protein